MTFYFPTLTRRSALGYLGISMAVVAGCSASPSNASDSTANETTATTSAALDPDQVIPQTEYTITLTEVDVNEAVEPPSTVPSPDTGYVDWAELGVLVNNEAPVNQTTVMESCTLANAAGSSAAGTGATLTQCSTDALNNALFLQNKPLSVSFNVTSPNDTIKLGIALDNIEATTRAMTTQLGQGSSWSPPNGSLALTAVVLGVLSAVSTPVPGGLTLAAGIGAIVGATNSWFSLSSAFFPPSAGGALSLSEMTSCVGGLMGNPTITWPNDPTGYSAFGVPVAPPDTVILPFTAAQLAQIVSQGAGSPGCAAGECNEIDLDPTMTGLPSLCFPEPGYTCTQGTAAYGPFPGGGPGYDTGCSSSLHVRLQITRNWSGGPAASAKSADMAVVRAPGVIDTYASRYTDTELFHVWGAGTSFSTAHEPPSVVALENSGVTTETIPAVVSRSSGNLDMFYVDSNGTLNTVYQAAPAYISQAETLASGSVSTIRGITVAIPSIAPANALVTATARTPQNLDVFFAGTDGNIYTVATQAGMGNNALGLPKWNPARSITSGACVSTATACAGSASPGGGVAVVARNPNQLDVFYIGKDGGLWTSYWTFGSSWTTMEVYGPSSNWQRGNAVASPGAVITAAARTAANLDVFFVGNDGGLWTGAWVNGGGWGTWEIAGSANTGVAGGPISAVSRQPGALDVVYQGTNGTLEWGAWVSSGWRVAPIPTANSLSTSMIGRGGISLVAPDAYHLQAFYINAFHQENAVSWADPTECSTLSPTGCTAVSSDFPWTGDVTLPQPTE